MTANFFRTRAPIFLIVLLGAALRFHQLEYSSLWVDEIGQVVIARGGLLHAVLGASDHVAGAPLDYVVTWLALQLGQSEFILRFAPAAWSTATLALTYRLGRALTHSNAAANLAAFLLAISATAVRYAQEVRFYALGTFLFAVGVYLFVRAWQMPTTRNWAACALTLAVGFYAHYYALLILAGLVGFAGTLAASVRARWFGARLTREQGLGLAAASGTVLVLAIPWLIYAGRGAASYKPFDAPSTADILLKPIWGAGSGTLVWLSGGLLLLAAVLGAWTMWRAGSQWSILAVLLAFAGTAGVVAADFVVGYPFTPRQLVFFLPYYLILAAVGIRAVWSKLKPRPLVRYAVALGIVVVIGQVSAASLYAYYNQPKEDWRSAARLIGAAIQGGDEIRFTQPTLATYLDYYSPGLAKYVQRGTGRNIVRRAWIVAWGAQSRRQALALVPGGWNEIALDVGNGPDVLYAGPAKEDALWREASGFVLTPQVLAYSEVLTRAAQLGPEPRDRVTEQARSALANPVLPLFDVQRAMLEARLAAALH